MSGKVNQRCFFCHGNISYGRCIMCGRSDDVAHEIRVAELQRLPHRNLHTNELDVQKGSRSKKGNPNGYGKRNSK